MPIFSILDNGPVEVTLDESDPDNIRLVKSYPVPVKNMKVRVTTGTSPNEVFVGEQTIDYASMGTNNIQITDENLIASFNNQTLGTTFNYKVITNYASGTFPTGDEIESSTVSNQTVKIIPECTVSSYTYNYNTSDGYVSQTVSSNSNATLSYASSNPSILSIDPVTNKYNVPPLDQFTQEVVVTVTITQPSNSRYESVTTQETVIITQSELTSVPLVILPNGVTIRYTGNPANVTATPLFIRVNLRGIGIEWFAVVDDRHLQAIQNYARGLPGASALFTPPGQSSPVPFNNIVTTLMTNMSGMFQNATSFNAPLNSWDTSRVRDMLSMFAGATTFNQPLNSWNVSNVIHMTAMFQNALAFNQPLNSWNTRSVRSMFGMFALTMSFNQNISGWVVDNVSDARQFRVGNTVLNPNHLPRFRTLLM